MSIRRLARQAANSAGVLVNNWETQATETYVPATPAVGPVSWGTDPEIALLDRDFDAVGSPKLHLGALLTINAMPDFFWGIVAKIQPSYSPGEDPQFEMWTHDAVNGWVKRRKVDIPSRVRDGTVIIDLLVSVALTNIDQVWVTMAPTGGETNSWLELHLYGECNTDPLAIPDCPLGSDPPDCSADCDTLFPDWDCNPDDPDPPPVTLDLPPVTVEIPMPTTYTHPGPGQPNPGKWFHVCPGPTQIRMFFSLRNPAAAVRVTVVSAVGVIFNEGVSQIITGSGEMDWTVQKGFTLSPPQDARGSKFLPPRQLVPSITFLFTPIGAFTVLDLLDWEEFLWTYDIAYIELC